MLFMIHCTDKPDHQQLRADTRPEHLAYLDRFRSRIVAAGPTLDEDGATPTGSLLLIEFSDRAEAETFAREDPYAQAGLFERVDIRPWKKVLP